MADALVPLAEGADFVHAPRYPNQNSGDLETWRTRCGLIPHSMNDSRLTYSSDPERVTCPTCRAALTQRYSVDGLAVGDTRTQRELPDFNPSTGHLHNCSVRPDELVAVCRLDCAGHLYAIAQDAETALARVRDALAVWEATVG